jgi:hypothetical protein
MFAHRARAHLEVSEPLPLPHALVVRQQLRARPRGRKLLIRRLHTHARMHAR